MAKVKAVPEGMHTLTTQLAVDGASEAIEFYKRAFGAEELSRAPDPSGKKVWHSSLRIGSSVLFVNDVFPDMGGSAEKAHLWLYIDNVDAAWKRAVDAGCTVRMPLADMFWGDRIGTVHDRWGNQWSLAQHIQDLTPEEMKKAQDAFVAQMKKH
jgi:uncharacterized glyoxalase superfamily protein PhnB